LEKNLKKIILLIFLLSFNAHSDPIKKCTSYFGKKLAKEIGISVGDTIINVISLGLLVKHTIPQYKNTHRINKTYTALNEIRNNRKWGLGFKMFAKDLGVTTNELSTISKEKPEIFCNDTILKSVLPYTTLLSEVRYYLSTEKRIKRFKNFNFEKSWVSLQNPFKTLDKSTYHYEYFFKDCLSFTYGNHPVKKMLKGSTQTIGDLTYQIVDPSCTPDVLFNWSGPGMLKTLKTKYNNNSQTWNTLLKTQFGKGTDPNALFTSFSPLATYGYGSENLRLKLKKNTKFYFIARGNSFLSCNKFPQETKENTVFIRRFKHPGNRIFMEYLLCNFGPVHSWSYGQEETFNEEVRQFNWIKKYPKDTGKYILYMHQNSRPILFQGILDEIEFSETLLRERITYNLSNLMLGKKGEIFYNPKLPSREKTARNHFKLDKPIYWNVTK